MAVLMGVALLALVALGALASPSQAQTELPDGPGSISITQTPSGGGGVCLPPALALRQSVRNTPTTFTLTIRVVAPLCARVNAVAAIYRMPGRGVAWPQTLVTTLPFTLREPGVTVVTFTKGCDPVQFDVITGATPQTISPTGPFHGPLLFPFDLSTSLQWWGCVPPSTTTTSTTTSTTTTTTIDDDCDGYTPESVTVSPSTARPGDTITVTGTGRPGSLIQVLLRPPPGIEPEALSAAVRAAGFLVLSDAVLVGEDGTWSTTVSIPFDGDVGIWIVAAQAVDCDEETTAEIPVDNDDSSTTTAPTTEAPEVAGETIVNTLPGGAVLSDDETAGGPRAAGLAFTGSSTHLPIIGGIVLIAGGGLLLLGSRRRSD